MCSSWCLEARTYWIDSKLGELVPLVKKRASVPVGKGLKVLHVGCGRVVGGGSHCTKTCFPSVNKKRVYTLIIQQIYRGRCYNLKGSITTSKFVLWCTKGNQLVRYEDNLTKLYSSCKEHTQTPLVYVKKNSTCRRRP
jgi:hypothetical protein